MIAKTALFPALAAEGPRKDEDPTERGGAGFGSLLDEQLRQPAADGSPAATAPAAPKMPARVEVLADATAAAPTEARIRTALEARGSALPGEDAPAQDGAEVATAGPRATDEAEEAPRPEPSTGLAGEPVEVPIAMPVPMPVAQAPMAAAPLAIPLLLSPPKGGDVATTSPGTDDAKPTPGEPQPVAAAPVMRDLVSNAPVRAPSRGASAVALAGKGPGRTAAGAAPGRAKIAVKTDTLHPSPTGDVATAAPPAIATVPAHAAAPKTDSRATTDQAHAATDLAPSPRGARSAMQTSLYVQSTRITGPGGDPTASEPGIDDAGPAASPLPAEAATGAQNAAGPPAPEAPAQDESTDLPRDLSALRTTIAASLPGAGARGASGPTPAPLATAAERPAQQKPAPEPARTTNAPEAPRAAGSASTATAGVRPPTTPGENPSSAGGHGGGDGRERQGAPERIIASDHRAPTTTPISDKVRPNVDARAERPVRTGSPEAAEPARGATPAEVLPSAAPIVKDAPASPVIAASAAPASLRHEPVAPSVNVVTLAAATRSEVDIPELGRIVIAAERRRNRVDLEIHAAEPATVQLLQEKAPEMLHEVNRVANVAAVNVHQSKADDAGKTGASGGSPRASDGSAGSGGHGARKEHRTPAEERNEAEITGPVARAGGRVRFVL